jgi:uracil-DNA glycosylase
MNLSDPDSPNTQLIVRKASSSLKTGLRRSKSGFKILRVFIFKDLLNFLERVINLKFLDIHRELLEKDYCENKKFWKFVNNPHIFCVRIRCKNQSLKNYLPPWLSDLSPPSEDSVYPKNKIVYPPKRECFSGLWFDPKELKVLIIGQDPYHGPGQAHGLAFSVKSGKTPPSLLNIFRELERTIPDFQRAQNSDLTSWFHQGIGLLNVSFSVEKGKAGSLRDNWSCFSDEIFSRLAKSHSPELVVLAWGGDAHSISAKFSRAKIYKSSHPSPFSYKSTNCPFEGCGHFSLVNEYLISRGLSAINWSLKSSVS